MTMQEQKENILTDKQNLFCAEYLVDLNATRAAIRAGYSANTGAEQGYQLLQQKHIQDKIRSLNEERMNKVKANGNFVIDQLLSIANDDIKNYVDLVPTKTGKLRMKWKDLSAVDTKNISELTYDKNGGFKFKRYSRENALVALGRHFGIFEDKLTIKSNLEKILSEYTENGILTDEGLTKLAEKIIDHHKKFNDAENK